MGILSSILLLSTLVYRYEFTTHHGTPQAGTPGSAYIDFATPCGENVPLTEAICDFQYVSWSNPGGVQSPGGPVLDPIPSFTYSSLEDPRVHIYRNSLNWDGLSLWGINMSFDTPIPNVSHLLVDGSMESFWPIPYQFNAYGIQGGFVFTGSRSVPEAGSTLAYLALGLIALIWRKK